MGWGKEEYLAQPDLFINQLLVKWSLDSEDEEMKAKQAETESTSKLKK